VRRRWLKNFFSRAGIGADPGHDADAGVGQAGIPDSLGRDTKAAGGLLDAGFMRM
jgi:hypothetical protein